MPFLFTYLFWWPAQLWACLAFPICLSAKWLVPTKGLSTSITVNSQQITHCISNGWCTSFFYIPSAFGLSANNSSTLIFKRTQKFGYLNSHFTTKDDAAGESFLLIFVSLLPLLVDECRKDLETLCPLGWMTIPVLILILIVWKIVFLQRHKVLIFQVRGVSKSS